MVGQFQSCGGSTSEGDRHGHGAEESRFASGRAGADLPGGPAAPRQDGRILKNGEKRFRVVSPEFGKCTVRCTGNCGVRMTESPRAAYHELDHEDCLAVLRSGYFTYRVGSSVALEQAFQEVGADAVKRCIRVADHE
nr:hypothetical protein Ade03nite_88270 [Actinoplanes derwentensis]